MHIEAYDFVRRTLKHLQPRKSVLEIGSKNVNGSCRDLFTAEILYFGIDIIPGNGVDLIADGATWRPQDGKKFDTVISTECLEHTSYGKEICQTAFDILEDDGVFILTAATLGRQPHGADGYVLKQNEYYQNVHPNILKDWMSVFKKTTIEIRDGQDIYAIGHKENN
jgi:hypothetical protein